MTIGHCKGKIGLQRSARKFLAITKARVDARAQHIELRKSLQRIAPVSAAAVTAAPPLEEYDVAA